MIESKDVLALCARSQEFLVPLDMPILRPCYNGLIVKSTYAVGRAMRISDETVRTIEHRALDTARPSRRCAWPSPSGSPRLAEFAPAETLS
jgi:hypothetical protein